MSRRIGIEIPGIVGEHRADPIRQATVLRLIGALDLGHHLILVVAGKIVDLPSQPPTRDVAARLPDEPTLTQRAEHGVGALRVDQSMHRRSLIIPIVH